MRWRSSPRVKPRCLHPRHPARLWRAPHVGQAPPRVPGPAGAGRGLLGPGRPRSACTSKHSLVLYCREEAHRCLTQWRRFLGMRIFLRACNKTNCWRQNNKTGSLSSSSGSSEVNSLKMAIFHPTASHQDISKTDIKRSATNHPET